MSVWWVVPQFVCVVEVSVSAGRRLRRWSVGLVGWTFEWHCPALRLGVRQLGLIVVSPVAPCCVRGVGRLGCRGVGWGWL